MGSYAGIQKAAARRIGVSVEFYLSQIAAGQKYCWHCRMWSAVDLLASIDRGLMVAPRDARDAGNHRSSDEAATTAS